MYRPSLAVLTGVVVVAGAACGGETESASSKEDYVSANERLLQTLPRFLGVREVSRSSAAYNMAARSGRRFELVVDHAGAAR